MKKLDELLRHLEAQGFELENYSRRLNEAGAKLSDARIQLKYEKENYAKVKKECDWTKNEIRKLLGEKP